MAKDSSPFRTSSRAAAAGPASVAVAAGSAILRLFVSVLAFVPATAVPAAAELRVDAGGGAFVPYDGNHRQVYGSSPSFGLGVSSGLGARGARVFLDVAHVRGSGDELSFDPTFQNAAESTYRLWPVTLGVRFDLNPVPEQALRLYLGFGVRTVFTRWEGVDATGSAPTLGALAELRPEYHVGDRMSVWVRQRLDAVRDVDYGPRGGLLDYSAATLELGLSLSLDEAPLTPPGVTP